MSNSDRKEGARVDDARSSLNFDVPESEALDISLVDIPGFITFWLLAIIVFLQFFTRYVLNDSLAWTEEIARYVLILVAFTGAVSVSRKGSHIFLEFFYRFIPPRAGKWLSIGVECITTVFFGYLAWLGVDLALRTKTKMASAEIPKSLLYWIVAACLAFMAIYSFLWILKKIKQSPAEIIQQIEDHTITD